MDKNKLWKKFAAIILAVAISLHGTVVYADEIVEEGYASEQTDANEGSSGEPQISMEVTVDVVNTGDVHVETGDADESTESLDSTAPVESLAPADSSEPVEQAESATEVILTTGEVNPIIEGTNIGGSSLEQYTTQNDGGLYNAAALQITPDVTFQKTFEAFSTSISSTGRYNANFVLLEKNERTGEVKRYNYTVSGFENIEAAERYVDKICNLNVTSSDILYGIKGDTFKLIDAEKRPWKYKESDGEDKYAQSYDSELCWAGSISDMLELSGWNKAEELTPHGYDVSNEDRIFDLFANLFTDAPGNQYYGLEWLFNGVYRYQGLNGPSQLKSADSVRLSMLNDYCSEDMISLITNVDTDNFCNLLKTIDSDEDGDRCALGMVFGYYVRENDGSIYRDGGHCVTITGYSTDENGVPKTITISDSDNYNNEGTPESSGDNNRESYLNTYYTYPVEYFDGKWHIMNYVGGADTIIDNLITLKYYSDNTKGRIDDGTRDLTTTIDYDIYKQGIFRDYFENRCLQVYEGEKIYAGMRVFNRSSVRDFEPRTIPYRFTISSNGEVVRSVDYLYDSIGLDYIDAVDLFSGIIMDENSSLEPGEYTLSFLINYNRDLPEAYYNNDIRKIKFIVLKRVDNNGGEHYIVVPSDNNNKEPVTEFIQNVNEYSVVVDSLDYKNDESKILEYVFTNGLQNIFINDEDIMNASLTYDYSFVSDMGTLGGGIIKADVTLCKDDFAIVRNPDGTLKLVLTNEFMRKLSKGTHYFKINIAGKTVIFRIEIK